MLGILAYTVSVAAYLQYADLLVTTERVADVVPAAMVPDGCPPEITGGVVSTTGLATENITVTDADALPAASVHWML